MSSHASPEQTTAARNSVGRREPLLCVPNFSEGRNPVLIEEIVRAARDDEVRLLHRTSDIDHDRTVLTLCGTPAGLVRAIERLAKAAAERIDLRRQRGVHPRLGVLDVVPFVPLGTTPMSSAIAAAKLAGERLAKTFPVFFYEAAASTEERRDLAAHRRGGLETLRSRMADGTWPCDLGPQHPREESGVVLVGARRPLIAFNVELSASDPRAARRIAGRIRQSAPGGLPGVKALGLALASRGRSQVSMNIVDPQRTSLFEVVERIRAEARNEGVEVLGSELIGLLGRDFALEALSRALALPDLRPEDLLEHQLEYAPAGTPSLHQARDS